MQPGQRVLLVDDRLATGRTMNAACELVTGMRATIVGIAVLIEVGILEGRGRLRKFGEVHSVLRY